MNKLLVLGVVSMVAITGCSNLANSTQSTAQDTIKASTNTVDVSETKVAVNQAFDYQDFGDVLQTYVNDQGLVDYAGLQVNREQLDRFNQSLGDVTAETYASWSEAEQIAFLTNAYNAFTLQSIIDQNPLKDSIRDISGVWNRRKFTLAGEQKTLNNIEHDILRKEFNEPRIHVALVCAAISCPPLRNEPYLPETLDAQLDDQTIKFAASPHGFSLDAQDKRVYISSIFKWYGQDFEPSYGTKTKFKGNDKQRAVLNYLSPVLKSETQTFLNQEDYKVKYLDYDWSLNKQ
ncbi:MAG: DUF547 domain-containing protein [Cyanobacteria bacterium P01_G01_bin.67]